MITARTLSSSRAAGLILAAMLVGLSSENPAEAALPDAVCDNGSAALAAHRSCSGAASGNDALSTVTMADGSGEQGNGGEGSGEQDNTGEGSGAPAPSGEAGPPSSPPRNPPAAAVMDMDAVGRGSGFLWDYSGELGVGWRSDTMVSDDPFLFVRGRVGGTWYVGSHYLTLGGTAERSGWVPPIFGAQFEWLDVRSAVFAQATGHLDLEGRPGWSAALGWQLFGAEYQRHSHGNGVAEAWIAKVRIPVSWFVSLVRGTPGE